MAQLLLSEPGKGTVLKARLPLPQSNHALRMLLETVAHWYGRPLVAVLDADAEEVAAHPERWGVWLAEVDDLDVTVRWVRRGSERARDRFFDGVGESARARKLLSFEAGGQ
jgi:hypothetical protein